MRPPQPLLALVLRERLLKRLSAATAPVIVVSAPGGFGKTVALMQWAASDGHRSVWLQADAADNDPLLFLQYLLAALGRVAVIDPQVTGWLQQAPPPVETRILPALAAAVQEADPFVLIVDDVHQLINEACWQLLGLLLEQMPPGAHLCLSGRAAPRLPLARLRAAGRLVELGPEDLSLSRQETDELLRLHGLALDDETVAHLQRVTEGWAAGLYLAALAGTKATGAEKLSTVRGDQRAIADYLASEVLEQQPADLAAFLLRTSILERLSSSLCRAVTGDDAAGERLRGVAHRNLFISALDDAGEWFRYHHLFAEFLQAELLRRDEKELQELHRRAAAWFEEREQLEEAVRHWLAAGEPGHAGAIVCRAHMHFTHLARYETIRRWLDMFTDEQILSDEALTLATGWIGPMAGDTPQGRTWISAAFRLKVGDGLWPGSNVPLRAMQAALIGAHAPEGVAQMRENAELAVALSEEAPHSMRAAVITQLGIARWLGGDSEGALSILRDGEEEGALGNVLAQITAAGYQALILADQARWGEARGRLAVCQQRLGEAGLKWGISIYPGLLAQARLEVHDGSSNAAESIAAIDALQGSIAPFQALLTDVLVGEMLLHLGDLPLAVRWAHSGFMRLASLTDAGILRPRLLRLRERLEERCLLEPLTPAERKVLELLPTELSAEKIAKVLWVSRETVRTHIRDIYRKLGVHSRSEAVARARELMLLQDP